MDRSPQALYDSDRRGGLGSSSPSVARWLGDIREYFPSSVVQVMQQDALERLDMKRMLMEPEMLDAVQPNVRLVADLISLAGEHPGEDARHGTAGRRRGPSTSSWGGWPSRCGRP